MVNLELDAHGRSQVFAYVLAGKSGNNDGGSDGEWVADSHGKNSIFMPRDEALLCI